MCLWGVFNGSFALTIGVPSKQSALPPVAHLTLLVKCLIKLNICISYLCVWVCVSVWLVKCCNEVRGGVFSPSSFLPVLKEYSGLWLDPSCSTLDQYDGCTWAEQPIGRLRGEKPAELQHNNTHSVDTIQVSGLLPGTIRPIFCTDTALSFTNIQSLCCNFDIMK